MNIVDGFEGMASRQPERAAILFEGGALSYGDLLERVQRLSAFLRAQPGLVVGSRIAIYLPNIPEFAVAYLATLKLGMVAVSVGAMLREREVLHVLSDSGASVLLTHDVMGERAKIPGLRVVYLGSEHDHDLAREPVATVELPADAPAAILYTSGTTGAQKGATLTHGNLVSNAEATGRYTGSSPEDRHMLFLPLFHCFGQNFIMNTTLRAGGAIVLMRRFELGAVLEQVARAEATHFYAVPTIYIQLLEHPEAERLLASVRYFFSAAATMPVDTSRRFRDRFGRPIYEGYGLTETSPLASYNHESDYRLGSIGVPIEHVSMKVVAEDGSECGPGTWGEICIKGPNVMAGYFGREQETSHALRDGWFHSGDIGYRDADGYYYLVDRLKDMINRAGFKIWPREVEEVLYQHPAVKECAVVAAAHPTLGESVLAYVTRNPGSDVSADTLRAYCQDQLSSYKVPERFVFDEEIPKSPAGKILKRELRRRANAGES